MDDTVDQVAVDQGAVDQVAVAKLFFESMSTVNEQFNSQMEGTLKVLLEVLPGQYDNILTQFVKEYMKYVFCLTVAIKPIFHQNRKLIFKSATLGL